MPKKLIWMNWEDVQKEMSIAGDPEKVTMLCKNFMEQIERDMNCNQVAVLINLDFGLRRIQAEIRNYKRILEKRTGQKY